MVGFDTTILPGREGTVTEEVALDRVHDGAFTKCLTVNSNAKNKPSLQLCMKGFVKVPVAVSPGYPQMRRGSNGLYETDLTLSTDKPDLKVLEVFFTPGSGSSGQTPWQNTLPLHCEFKLTRPDSAGAGGIWAYRLAVSTRFEEKDSKTGEFVIKTNHPDAGEVKTTGNIEASASTDQKK
ncbi:MAG TPA: hypothetical protein VLX68_09120 [Chitinivibrionales bacterium]|nr:hypothetical protein [Chitinivibrionales bacterium]